MASVLFWSWIFISLIRPAFALPVNARALPVVFIPEFEQDDHTMAVAITIAVILVALIVGIILSIMRNRKKVEEPEMLVAQPTWFMVKPEKVQWWHNFRSQSSPTEDSDFAEGSRIERIKAALSRKKETPILPLYNESKSFPSHPEAIVFPPNSQPQYSDILERGYKAPLYQAPIPTLTRTMYESHKLQPRSPPKAMVTSGLSRSLIRGGRRGLTRSPAARQKSWLSGATLRHPFLPLKDTDAPSVSMPPRVIDADLQKARFLNRPQPWQPVPESRSKLGLPVKPALRPPPLDLEEEPRRKIRFGSPKIRIVSPAF